MAIAADCPFPAPLCPCRKLRFTPEHSAPGRFFITETNYTSVTGFIFK
jgi:hypothetical protein